MATLRDLETACGPLFGKEPKQVHVVAMMLRKHGLIGTAGRGLNAAQMAPADIANMYLALLADRMPTKAAETIGRYRGAMLTDGQTRHAGKLHRWFHVPGGECRPSMVVRPSIGANPRNLGDVIENALIALAQGKEEIAPIVMLSRRNGAEDVIVGFIEAESDWCMRYQCPNEGGGLVSEIRIANGRILLELSQLLTDHRTELPPERDAKIAHEAMTIHELATELGVGISHESYDGIYGED